MRKLYLVVGPERCGTRMLTEALIVAGCAGNAGHKQAFLDEASLELQLPETEGNYVVRMSVPHAGRWPELAKYKELDNCEVQFVAIFRETWAQEKSLELAWGTGGAMERRAWLFEQLAEVDAVLVDYEALCDVPEYRHWLFWEKLGLESPAMVFANANLKYLVEAECAS